MHLGLRLLQRGGGGIDVLLGGRQFGQALLPIVIGLRLGKIGLGVRELRLRLLKLRREILARDFGAELLARKLRFCRRQRALGLFAVVDVLPRIDVDQQLVLLDELVVVDVERNDVPAICDAMLIARPSV